MPSNALSRLLDYPLVWRLEVHRLRKPLDPVLLLPQEGATRYMEHIKDAPLKVGRQI